MQIKRILAVLALLLMPSIVAAWGPMVGSGVESGGGGWSCTDAGLLCESFDLETAGNYDNTATEVGTEGTINADATHSGTFACADKGDEALQIVKNANSGALYTYFDAGAENTHYVQFYIYIGSEGLVDTENTTIASLSTNTSFSTICYNIRLKQTSGALDFELMHYNGTAWQYNLSSANVATGSWYGIRVYYTYNTGSGGIDWEIDFDMDGSYTAQTVNNDGTTTRQGRYIALGHTGATRNTTLQFDNLKDSGSAYATSCP